MPWAEGAKGAVGRGVAVAADDRHARQSEALFGPDNVHDALADIVHVVEFDTEIFCVLAQRVDLQFGFGIGNPVRTAKRRYIVVRHGEGLFRRARFAPGHAQAFKRLRACHFVNQVAVDIQDARAVFGFIHQMGVPDFVVQGLRGHSWSQSLVFRSVLVDLVCQAVCHSGRSLMRASAA